MVLAKGQDDRERKIDMLCGSRAEPSECSAHRLGYCSVSALPERYAHFFLLLHPGYTRRTFLGPDGRLGSSSGQCTGKFLRGWARDSHIKDIVTMGKIYL